MTQTSIRHHYAAVALAFAPIFIANLVFAQRFREVGSATTAFAANLLGAIAGGMIEYLALVSGYRFLLVVVAVEGAPGGVDHGSVEGVAVWWHGCS